MKRVLILGSTGSIGISTLEVLSLHRDQFAVLGLTACQNVDKLYAQCLTWQPRYAVMADPDSATQLAELVRAQGMDTEVLAGVAGLCQVASLAVVDYVVAAIVGAAGLLPTITAAQHGKRILLANKESLVMAGDIFIQTVRANKAELLPVDSEHNAIFQCLPATTTAASQQSIERILLTASGGPFRQTALADLAAVTPQEACAHPNWEMGRKISVDSATMMNKGLEVIEAHWLFAIPAAHIDVVVHPQSVVHSMVEYNDGSVLAQLGNPDMRTPIAYALAWPERIAAGVARLDLLSVARLDFLPPDTARFPCLALAYQALHYGGSASTVLNAANEIAVEQFLAGHIGFMQIPTVVEETLSQVSKQEAASIDDILAQDASAREFAGEFIKQLRTQ